MRVAITGAAGQLGRQLVAVFEADGHLVRGLSHDDLDITRPDALLNWEPDVVINAAAWTDVDGCARDPERAMRINGVAAGAVAAVAADRGALIVQVSTNEVFDGSLDRPYTEDDEPNPINAYGRSKLAGERAVVAANPRHLIVRTAWLFGPGGNNFVTKILAAGVKAAGDAGQSLRLVEDEIGNPTWTPDLARAILALVMADRPSRIAHVAGLPAVSRLGWAQVALEAAGVTVDIEPVALASFERDSTPPLRAALAASAGVPDMDWRPVTRAYAADTTAAVRS
ncbi:MAG: dTDP-4-dehydrorhamnose reductase [Candidatus Limnocylindria bacterium]